MLGKKNISKFWDPGTQGGNVWAPHFSSPPTLTAEFTENYFMYLWALEHHVRRILAAQRQKVK